jgi:hypothetical protein
MQQLTPLGVQLVAVLAQPVVARTLTPFIQGNVASGRTRTVVVMDPMVDRFFNLVD